MENRTRKKKKVKLYRAVFAIVILFVAIAGISGYINFSNNKIKDSISKIDIDTDFSEDKVVPSVADQDSVFYVKDSLPKEQPADAEIKQDEDIVKADAPLSKMIMPSSGDVLTDYSDDKLVYNKTLEDWRAHKAIDIANKIGTPVVSALDGTVEKIENDEMMGVTVTIKHSDSLITRYCNLQKEVVVKKGDVVKAGDVIGGIGNSAAAESLESPHLHFEVEEGGVLVNPYDFF